MKTRSELAEASWWLLPLGEGLLLLGGILYGGIGLGCLLVGAAMVAAALVGYGRGE